MTDEAQEHHESLTEPDVSGSGAAVAQGQAPFEYVWKTEGMGAGFGDMDGVIKEITLAIKPGEHVALLGAEKSGRSLLLRVLSGLRPFRDGKLHFCGEDLSRLPFFADWDEILSHEKRRKMGICLEREGLLSNVTAREGLELLFRFKYGDHNQKLREGSKRVVNQLAVRFGIAECLDKRPHALTSAERRLVGIARAFLSKPSIIALENPSENIGNLNRKRLMSVFEEICSQKERTVLIPTDDWPLAHRFCPRWIVLKEGGIVFDGDASKFLKTSDDFARQIKDLMDREQMVDELLRKAS